MITRSLEPEVFREGTKDSRDCIPDTMDFEGWINNHRNVMLVEDDNIGLASFEYPGLYNVHWFFGSARGREAIKLARRMLDHLFSNYDAKAIRGLTKANLKAARWASRQVGLTSYGIVHYPDGDHELFCMTKEEFYNGS